MTLRDLLVKYNINTNPKFILDLWREPQRHYHNIGHLQDLLDMLHFNSKMYSQDTYELLLLVAYFHDIIYDPTKNNNEEESANLFLNLCKDKKNPNIQLVYSAILDTKNHENNSWLSTIFNEYDLDILNRDYEELLKWENGIYNEYKYVGDESYKKHRLMFLTQILDKKIMNTENILKLIDYVKEKY